MKKNIAILGSTGSIGKTTVNIIRKNKANYNICLLSTNKNIKEILKQAKDFNVKNLIIADKEKFNYIKNNKKHKKINFYNNFNDLNKIFKKKIDYTMSSISGLDGLEPTLKIIKHTKKIAIANKESIICGWNLINKEIKKNLTTFIPVDSEHFSIWSLLNNTKNNQIEEVVLTASGGPFLNYPIKKFINISPEMAIKHPNWSMGKKISIDSATLMNKVFEIIEAQRIFDIKIHKFKIMIHPNSYIHAIVKFKNGLIKFLAHDTDMTIPIFNSLANNQKIKTKKIDYKTLNDLKLSIVDNKRYPSIKILKNIKNKPSLYETAIVSANDELVDLFYNKKIKFTEISYYLQKILNLREILYYKNKFAKNHKEIKKFSEYVRLKTINLCI
ncbi:1-deoxy-D-xylulose-5-phosphate reductoisomerase [Candidatus Pelagibacter sp.]|jgi:1-deoxy-D-xylulose-5-phosphate reductoisomerase|nr:1-deoxy-D-xylulose-5-phosphate reductoisomerase [Candidatus Pelagibacter sp.]